MSEEKQDLLSVPREAFQMVEFFAHYCFDVGEMFTLSDDFAPILRACSDYAEKICDDCGGAMDCDMCPVHCYIRDFKKVLAGERTSFAKAIRREEGK